MGLDLAKRFSDYDLILSETFREADAALGFSLSSIIKEGPAEKLKQTELTQPALLTVSTAMGRWLKSRGIVAQAMLGHSLGEYSALVHAEVLAFKDAIRLVHLRGELMQSAIPAGEGGMAALISATPESAVALCARIEAATGQVLEVSAYNAPGQIVISGHSTAIDQAILLGKEFGIRSAIKLQVSGPFHCRLLQGAGEKLKIALDQIEFYETAIPVIANTTALAQKAPTEIRGNLVDQVSKAVRFEESIRSIAEEFRACPFIEVGSGKVLTGLIKKILPEAECQPLESLETFSL